MHMHLSAHGRCLQEPVLCDGVWAAVAKSRRHIFRDLRRKGRTWVTHCSPQASQQRHREVLHLDAEELTPAAFSAFGQVIGPTEDGKEYDGEDAQLQLDQGQPRFYIMRIPRRGLAFDRITYHNKVTQCLGALQPDPWYLAVAAPSGSVQAWPRPADLRAFRIPHGSFVKLHAGTWHAGPLFAAGDHMDFYNLELADTNVHDHNTKEYSEEGMLFEIVDA